MPWGHCKKLSMEQSPRKLRVSAAEDKDPSVPSGTLIPGSLDHTSLDEEKR